MGNLDLFISAEFWLNVILVIVGTVVCYGVLRTLVAILGKRLSVRAQTRSGWWYKVLAEIFLQTSHFLLLAFSVLLALKWVNLPDTWRSGLEHGWFLVLALQIALWLNAGVRLWSSQLISNPAKHNPVTTTIISVSMLVMVWAVMLLSMLSNLGVNVTAMVASLGVGGIAVALAVQSVLSDILASLSIGIDKPFEIGDFVVFNDIAGSIEHIGLKTTRIRSLSGEQIVCSNTQLLGQTLHNYKRMDTRRIVFQFGISYNTATDKIREVSGLIKRIIDATEATRFDRAHFLGFEESKLTFEVVYIVLSSDYNRYMDIQQEINLQLLQGLRELNVQFAFPTRNVEFIGGSLPQINVAGTANLQSAANNGQK